MAKKVQKRYLWPADYMADPSVHVWDGKLYIYPSHDWESGIPEDDFGSHFDMKDYHVLSLEGDDPMTSPVKDHGIVLDKLDIPWHGRQLWDCDVARKNGKYYIDNAEFKLQVSADPIDPYVTYRIIDPSFEVWHRVEIRERDVTSFRERILSDWRHTENSCMNCHIHGSGRGNLSFFHLRGPKGGTILNRNGVLRKLTLKNDSMPVAATYGDFHPSGRYAVYTWNNVIPALRALDSHRMEVYDTASDMLVTDFDTNSMLFSPKQSTKATFRLVDGPGKVVSDWTIWDLTALGEVTKVEFAVTGNVTNDYGFALPAYFAYDDVAVRFPKK